MSTTPKRHQEDGNHPSSSKRPHDEASLFSNHPSKLAQASSRDYHQPMESAHGGKLVKFSRIEIRDSGKISPLLQTYRVSSCVESSPDHHGGFDARLESRDPRESRDSKVENREAKTNYRCLQSVARMDSQAVKGDKDPRDEKETKLERDPILDMKAENKSEKDSFQGNIHLTWKEHREQHYRGKRYSESSTDGYELWRNSHPSLHEEHAKEKEFLATEKRDRSQAHESVGENKLDLKSENSRDKEKEEKYKDWSERDRNDQHSFLFGGINAEQRDLAREERESEKLNKERRDLKEKEKLKEKDKDHVKEMPSNVGEEGLHVGKEVEHLNFSEQEGSEQKRPNECGRGAKEKKREKDREMEDDTPLKLGKSCDNEVDDVCNEGTDGVPEKDRDGFISGVQQRKRMLRPRGTPQSTNREGRFRLRAREHEGYQGNPAVSSVIYKPGECMQELTKLWKDFEAEASKIPEHAQNGQVFQKGPTLEIRIPAEYATATNRQVRSGQLWGTDVYTDDSDLVAVLMHTGYCRPTTSPPPSAVQELRATVHVLPPQDSYASTLRNNVRSRAWGAAIGCSYRAEHCSIIKKGGGTIDLEPCLTHSSAIEPTVAPLAVERTMTTRAAASNALRQQRFVREVTVQYNLCNEPWLKYSISAVADKGLKKSLFTSARLKKGEVLYVETHRKRYELCFNGEKVVSSFSHTGEPEAQKIHNHSCHDKHHMDHENVVDVFRWSWCKKPLPQNITKSVGIPLPLDHVEVLEDNLDWEDVEWSQTGVWISGREYPLVRVHFMRPN